MKCEECGREVPGESMFCPHCGAKLDDEGGANVAVDGDEDAVDGGRERFHAARKGASGAAPSEEELWSGTYSPKAMYGTFISAAIVTILGGIGASLAPPIGWMIFLPAAAIIWVALLLVLAYRRLSVSYRLTTFRFFHETGLVSRTRNRIEVIDINDVTLRQGVLERMFDVGTIHVQSSDVTHPILDLAGIENVKYVADLIDDTRRAERQRRGLFMENI